MPCRDDGPHPEQDARRKRDLDAMARLACERCEEIESQGLHVPPWAVEWWTAHKQADELRIKEEAAFKRDEEVRRRAIAKLTPKERAVLGVRKCW